MTVKQVGEWTFNRKISQISLKYLHLCFEAEWKSYGFGMLWVSDYKIYIFGQTIYLIKRSVQQFYVSEMVAIAFPKVR